MAFAIIEDAEEPRMTSQIDEVVRDAHELAKSLRMDTTLSAMQRLAVDRIITGFEAARHSLAYTPREAWFERHGKLTADEAADLEVGTYGKPCALDAEARLILTLEARTREYESAIEEDFKPSLRQAIADVMEEFVNSPATMPSMKAESE